MTEEKIREEFFEMASRHHSTILEGGSKYANRLHKKLMKLYQKAKKIGKHQLFLEFLNNHNEGVRLWAASFSLNSHPELAVGCLNDLAKLPTITSMQAEMILKLWDKGELELL